MSMTRYEYKGYLYSPWDDREVNNLKTFHDVVGPNCEDLSLPCSPYDNPTEEYFRLWVDAGCPYPERQRVSILELRETVFTKITEDVIEDTN